jgi:hypothetical protein
MYDLWAKIKLDTTTAVPFKATIPAHDVIIVRMEKIKKSNPFKI